MTTTFPPTLASLLPGEWVRFAVCAQTDPEVWFPPPGGLPHEDRAALQICARCPVRLDCLDFAMRAEGDTRVDRYGIWGGLTARQRYSLARRAA